MCATSIGDRAQQPRRRRLSRRRYVHQGIGLYTPAIPGGQGILRLGRSAYREFSPGASTKGNGQTIAAT